MIVTKCCFKSGPKMSWGTELWDRFHELTNHHQNGIDFLENSVANFIRERGKIEAAYAKELRGLVKKFSPKEASSAKNAPEPLAEQLSHILAYKQVIKHFRNRLDQKKSEITATMSNCNLIAHMQMQVYRKSSSE